jgi:hypothetical protein
MTEDVTLRNRCGRRAWLVAGAFVVALATAGTATASGGLSISHAPTIGPGTKVSENSSTDRTAPGGDNVGQGCFNDVEYWRLPLTAGDQVKITGSEMISARGFLLAIFTPATTDKNIASASSVAHGYPAEHLLRFAVSSTGVYPLAAGPNCYNGTDGPYTFVVTISHHKAAAKSR